MGVELAGFQKQGNIYVLLLGMYVMPIIFMFRLITSLLPKDFLYLLFRKYGMMPPIVNIILRDVYS
jgi:hypothetical protein